MTTSLQAVADLVLRESGIRLGVQQYGTLAAAIRRLDPALDPPAFLRLVSDPREGRHAVRRLVEEIAIHETWFFRDRGQLEAIDWRRLRAVATDAGSVTIDVWSVGCATGEEPYTLAIAASEAFAPERPPVRILATDISELALVRARRGEYGARALREVDERFRGRYFVAGGDRFSVRKEVRELVSFERHNVVRDPVPPLAGRPFELVVCRNVLIYFEPETSVGVIGSLEGALAPGGTLVLGAADGLAGSWTRRPSSRSEPARPAPLRPPPRAGRPEVELVPAEALALIFRAAEEGRHEEAIEQLSRVLDAEPFSASAYFARGLVELGRGEFAAAVTFLRRTLYVDPSLSLAAFKLGRAYDGLGEGAAARRAYERTLRTLAFGSGRDDPLLEQVDPDDVAAACRARIGDLTP